MTTPPGTGGERMLEARAIVLELMSALGDEPHGAGPEWVTVAQLVDELEQCTDPRRASDLVHALHTFVANRPTAKGGFGTDPAALKIYVLDKVGINNPPAPLPPSGGERRPRG